MVNSSYIHMETCDNGAIDVRVHHIKADGQGNSLIAGIYDLG